MPILSRYVPNTLARNKQNASSVNQNALEQTATWLNRASNILANRPHESNPIEFQRQIDEVKKLICEVPIVQKSSTEVPGEKLNIDAEINSHPPSNVEDSEESKKGISAEDDPGSSSEKAPSFPTTCSSNIKEVEALVGFFNSVRRETDMQKKS